MRHIWSLDLGSSGLPLLVTRLAEHTFHEPFSLPAGRMTNFDLHYITAGEMTLSNDSQTWQATAGDLILRGPGDACRMEIVSPLTLLHCHFSIKDIAPVRLVSGLEAWAHTIRYHADSTTRYATCLYLPDQCSLLSRNEMDEHMAAIMLAQDAPFPGSALVVHARFLLMLHHISHEAILALTQQTTASTPGHQHIRRAVQFINAHLNQPITPGDVAAHLDLTPDYLGRLFNRYFGESSGDYLLHRRLAVAKRLLVSSTLSIKEVAASVGFRDPLYFSRLFRREVGLSPGAYRREQVEWPE